MVNKKDAMKVLLFFFFTFFLFSAQLPAQKNAPAFPHSFVGNWKGSLQWMVTGKPVQTFTMQLRVQPTDTAGVFTWQIIYGDKEQDNRPYLLKPADPSKNHWVIDENNGIVLDNYVFGSCLTGAFTVMDNTILNSYCLEDGKLKVEFSSIKLSGKKTTGNGTDDSPNVDTYRVASYQAGVLVRTQ
jgi:hypothetical protein